MFGSFSLGELFVTQGVASDEDIENARRYLTDKWGLAEEPDESQGIDLPRWYARHQVMLQTSAQWSLLSPRLFRYLDQQFIDAFFDKGELRISSFASFHAHEDDERRDQEGRTINVGQYVDPDDSARNVQVYNVSAAGTDAYVLSASLVESRQLMQAFETDGYFVIEDPWGFALAIQDAVPAFSEGLQGHCNYSPRGREVYRNLDFSMVDLMEQQRNPDGSVNMEVLPLVERALSGPERLFHKPARYAHQAEYRLLWGTSREVEPYLTVVCPDARRYCRKIT
jgi:hypothetical protein